MFDIDQNKEIEQFPVGFKEESRHNAIKEYRKLLNDHESSDGQISKRLKYLESLCRNVIRLELQQYVDKNKGKTKNR